MMRRYYISIICLALFSAVTSAHAQFRKTTSVNWLSSSKEAGTAGVTVLPAVGNTQRPIGLIVYASEEVIPAQSFNPSKLGTDKSASAFLRYDPVKHAYTELMLPYGKTYLIDGNVTFRVGQSMRVAISTESTENGSLPYVSIVQESDPHAVLALLGTDVVTNGTGARLESYLDAGVRNTTEVFEVLHGDLYLQGIKFSEQKIGLPNQSTQSNTCLTKGVLWTPRAQYLEILKGNIPQDIQKQVRAALRGEDSSVLQKYTVLNVLSTGVVLVLDGFGQVAVVSAEKERVLEVPICTLNNL